MRDEETIDATIIPIQTEDLPVRKPYHHGGVPDALRAAVRQCLEEGDPENVGLRDLARRIGVSATAAYRHFENKDDLMASVAAEGFKELTQSLRAAEDGRHPGIDVGLAYLEFALAKPGLFRLMFGPSWPSGKPFRNSAIWPLGPSRPSNGQAPAPETRLNSKARSRPPSGAPSMACRRWPS